ncbi:MAG: hypothetical protein J5992_09370 [Oscillospiraceae bacterium]|nr:hypothetical protein [Oscillospiraceae bacterium]
MILIIECIVCCLVFHLLIALVHKKDNLLMAGSYPPKIRERLREMGVIPKEQKTRFSKKEIIRKVVGVIVFSIIIAFIMIFVNGQREFLGSFLSVLAISLSITWYDAIIMDCLIFCHDKRKIIKGTEDLKEEYRDYLFHIKQSMIGTVISVILSLVSAGFVVIISNIIK